MAQGGITNRQLRKIHAMADAGKPIGFVNLKLVIMNNKNAHTGKYYTEKEADNIAGFINKTYKHKYAGHPSESK